MPQMSGNPWTLVQGRGEAKGIAYMNKVLFEGIVASDVGKMTRSTCLLGKTCVVGFLA